MATQVKLSARPRVEAGRNAVKQVRARGAVPAVIYGAHQSPSNLEVNRKEIERLLAHAHGEHLLVDLSIDGAGKGSSSLAIIQEVQHHPVRGDILHIDFHAVSATETIQSEVPVEHIGEPEGVKTFGGILQQQVRSVLLEALPQNLPEVITVDVSSLNVGESFHIRDLVLPTGVTAVADEDITVFLVSEPNVPDEAPAGAAAAPEVIKEKKPDAAAADKK
jgi:large subunit ribosomal protein L25